jgi:hypothetical protein
MPTDHEVQSDPVRNSSHVIGKNFGVDARLPIRSQDQICSGANTMPSESSRTKGKWCNVTAEETSDSPAAGTQTIIEMCLTFQDIP